MFRSYGHFSGDSDSQTRDVFLLDIGYVGSILDPSSRVKSKRNIIREDLRITGDDQRLIIYADPIESAVFS